MYYIVLPVCEDYAGKTMSSKRKKFQRYFGSSLLLTLPTLTSSSFFFFFLLASLLMIFSQFLSACVCVCPLRFFQNTTRRGKRRCWLVLPTPVRVEANGWKAWIWERPYLFSTTIYSVNLSLSLSWTKKKKKGRKKKKLTPVVGFTPQCPVVCVCV